MYSGAWSDLIQSDLLELRHCQADVCSKIDLPTSSAQADSTWAFEFEMACTALCKLHLTLAARYSEDIDLVQVQPEVRHPETAISEEEL